MYDRDKLIVRLKNGLRSRVFPLWQGVNGVEEGVQDTIKADAFRRSPNGVIAAEHLPETFAQHVMCPIDVN